MPSAPEPNAARTASSRSPAPPAPGGGAAARGARVALVYPPACDPTAPYLSLAALAGFLRSRGREVVPIDANVEAFDRLLSAQGMARVGELLEQRLAALERRHELRHADALAYAALWRARGDARRALALIDDAKALLRDPERFYDASAYGNAVETIEAALRTVSAAYFPTYVDFMTYRTPFGLTSPGELEASTAAEQSPFEDYLAEVLIPRLAALRVDVVGLSVCFPGQLHPAYLFGFRLKQALPHLHLTMGGPVTTQLFTRLDPKRVPEALGPFDSAVLFEGEQPLLALLETLEAHGEPADLGNIVTRAGGSGVEPPRRRPPEELAALPCPDFDGLPLESYFAPTLVLPYDPTRGCYWGRCAFCHYGLTERGTARYRERPIAAMVDHLAALAERYGTSHFYLSHDSVAPKTLVALARALVERQVPVRWATDLKPEPYLTAERAASLREGGAVACALGVESGSRRVLALIDKGQPPDVVALVVQNLARAGIAVEAMCFTDFPTETVEEARQTLQLVRRHRRSIAGFIVGEFGITHGSRVAAEPGRFGIGQTWTLEGDPFGLGLQYEPVRPWKTARERESIEQAIGELSAGWALRPYPWAGAVSTAHTILHYSHEGPAVFRERAREVPPIRRRVGEPGEAQASFNLERAWEAEARERAIWAALVNERRAVTREAYAREVASAPPLAREPTRYHFVAGREPVALHAPRRTPKRGKRTHRSRRA